MYFVNKQLSANIRANINACFNIFIMEKEMEYYKIRKYIFRGATKALLLAGVISTLSGIKIVAGATETVEENQNVSSEVNSVETEAETVTETVAQNEQETEETVKLPENNQVISSGVTQVSTLYGHYYAWNIPGIAVIESESSLRSEAEFLPIEDFYVTTWDINESTAPLAIESFKAVADYEQAVLGPAFQMNINKIVSGRFYSMWQYSLTALTTVAIPADFLVADTDYAVIYVKAGGEYEVLPDLDSDNTTVTFEAHAGDGAYALVRYN